MINPSICIPKIEPVVHRRDIFHAFQKLNIGKIDRIDITYNNITNSQRVFVHFIRWFDTPIAQEIKKILLSDDSVKIVHQFPLFWKCYLSKVPKPYFI